MASGSPETSTRTAPQKHSPEWFAIVVSLPCFGGCYATVCQLPTELVDGIMGFRSLEDRIHAAILRPRRRGSWQLDPSRTCQRDGAGSAARDLVLCHRPRADPRSL